jgi:putative salt-induced outer membrane protein YdiY
MRRIFFISVLLTGFLSAEADSVLVLSNGDRLKGTVIREENGTVHFSSDVLGKMTLQKNQVKEIIDPSAKAKPAPPKSAPPKAAAAPAVKKAQALPKKPKRWSGNAGVALHTRHAEYERRAGSNLRRHERDTDYLRLTGKVKWDKERHHLEWNASYVYSMLNEKKDTDLYNWSQRYRCDLTDDWFGQSETSYEHNYLRILSKEIQQFTGIGWRPVKEPLLTLDLVPGVNYYYRDQTGEQTEGVTPGFRQNLTSKISKDLTLFQGFSYTGYDERYYYKFNAGLNNRLVKNLSLRVEYQYEVDANVKEGTDPFTQRQLVSSIQYRF